MEDKNSEREVRKLLDEALQAFGPPEKVENLEPDYPADYTPEQRVRHVMKNEYPRWRSFEWIQAASDTCSENCASVLRQMLSEGEIEIGDEGIRCNRYFIMYEKVDELTEKASENPNWLR